jgi:hypothetical protein
VAPMLVRERADMAFITGCVVVMVFCACQGDMSQYGAGYGATTCDGKGGDVRQPTAQWRATGAAGV